LETLVKKEATLRSSKTPSKLYEQLKLATIFVTHWISVNYIPTLDELREFYRRGAGIICKRNQRGADLILPLLFNDVMSAVIIQIKNMKGLFDAKWPDSASYKVSAEYAFKWKPSSPFLSLYLNLGTKSQTPCFIVNSRNEKQLALAARGVGPSTFPFLASDYLQGLTSIVQLILNDWSMDLRALHPDPVSSAQAMRLLPHSFLGKPFSS